MVGPETVRTSLSALSWSADGATVTKTLDLGVDEGAFGPRRLVLTHHRARPTARAQFAYELRVNQLLTRHRPPVPTPRLLGWDRRRATLDFEAVDGHPLGPKYPSELCDADLAGLVGLARTIGTYRRRPRWLRRLPISSRPRRARSVGLLSEEEHGAVGDVVRRSSLRWVFAHGDISPRNVVVGPEGPALIDWEWAGLCPEGYDLAFVWFVLGDLPDARRAVEAGLDVDPVGFWLSALVIELLHLDFGVPAHFLPRHLQTRQQALDRLIGRPAW